MNNSIPAVSIILPTFNREAFLPEALTAIRSQAFHDWELIVVDDGSTDGTAELISQLSADIEQPVRYLYQENQGAYGARNTGLDNVTGKYVAFYDSDDLWLPHHLQDCVEGLEANAEVDWVYGPSQIVEHPTGRQLELNSLYHNGAPLPFTRLHIRTIGRLKILDDPNLLRIAFISGVPSGLQNSVIRTSLFEHDRFRVEFRHECEDRLFILRAIANGRRIAYFDEPHVVYRVHESNSSAASTTTDIQKQLDILLALVNARKQLTQDCSLSRRETRALNWRISSELFWDIGYSTLWRCGRTSEALHYFSRALRLYPWSPSCWKTYVISLLRHHLTGVKFVEDPS